MHLTDSLRVGVEMRGEDLQSEGFFSYLRLEQRIPADHPLRAIRELVDAALKEVRRALRAGWPTIDPSRATVAGAAAANLLHGAVGATVDGAARL